MQYIFNKLKFEKGGLKEKLTKGIFWSFLGTIFSKGLNLVAFIVLARIFPLDSYGELGIIKSFISTFTLFSLGSFGVTATKYLALYKEEDKIKASSILSQTRLFSTLTSFLILLITIVFSKWIAGTILGSDLLFFEVQIGSIAIFFASLNGYQLGALSGFEKFKEISLVNILNGIVSIPLIIYSGIYFGVIGVVGSLAFINFLLWASSLLFLNQSQKEFGVFADYKLINKKDFNILWDFSLPSFLGNILVTPVILICNAILVKNSGYSSMGFYDAAYNFSIIAVTLNGVVGQVIYPFAMRMFGGENKKFEFLNINLSWFLGILILLPILVFPDYFSKIFGSDYEDREMYLTITIISLFTLIISQRQGIARNFAAGDLLWWSLFGNFLWGLFSIGLTFYLKDFGSVGRSSSFLFSYLLNTLIFIPFYISKNLIKRRLILSKYNFMIIFIVLFSSCLFYLSDSFLFRLLVLSFSFLGICYFFKNWFQSYVYKTNN